MPIAEEPDAAAGDERLHLLLHARQSIPLRVHRSQTPDSPFFPSLPCFFGFFRMCVLIRPLPGALLFSPPLLSPSLSQRSDNPT